MLRNAEIITTRVPSEWPQLATETIRKAMDAAIESRGECTLMLAGGVTIQPIYCHWAKQAGFPHDKVRYFFGDERCVPPDHADSNYGQTMQSLFPGGIPNDIGIHRMEGEDPDYDAAAKRYDAILPDVIEVLLFGMGEDGHIASLFPGDPALLESDRRVVPVIGPKPPPRRLTITPLVIAAARQVFLIAKGAAKGKVLAQALRQPEDVFSLPVRLAAKATWILDEAAAQQIESFFYRMDTEV